jgi:hypothetical protein
MLYRLTLPRFVIGCLMIVDLTVGQPPTEETVITLADEGVNKAPETSSHEEVS